MNNPMVQPALIGGLVMGVLTVLPIVNVGNLCCCAWVVSGGLVAAYLLQQRQPTPITPGDGALVGLFAGLFGAVVFLVLSVPISFMLAPMQRLVMERFAERMGNMPPEFREFATSFAGRSVGLILGFMFWLVCGAIFSTIGGLIGAAVFRKQASPQPPTMGVGPTA
jgi:hypothetical protein